MDEKQVRAAAEALGIATPQNTAGLRQLLERFGPMLTKENQELLTRLLAVMEAGGDKQELEELAKDAFGAAAKS